MQGEDAQAFGELRSLYEGERFIDHLSHQGAPLERELIATFGPEMEVVRVRGDYSEDAMPAGCVPGAWHVRRRNPAPEFPSYIPIVGPGETYRDPDSRVVAELAARDLRRRGVREDHINRSRTDAPHKAAERALGVEQRRDVLKEDFRAAKRVRGEGGLKKNFSKKGSR
ncbi:MAG: hypothetical protein JST59_06760 [Actinobacteria bacterium]|nr:hypothetical protein [Actinomycetota bacterium]